MAINTGHLDRTIRILRAGLNALEQADPGSIQYDLYRAACVKTFEMALELAGKLLRKALKPYAAAPSEPDRLPFKDVFRLGARHGLIELDACERWLAYRDNRNTTAHDYGEGFANTTLNLLPGFISDAETLSRNLNAC